MLKEITLQIITSIKNNGPISVFWAGILEQVISPIPSVIIPLSAGFFFLPRHLNFYRALHLAFTKIAIPYTFGVILGASVLYLLAFFGGHLLIKKFGHFFGVSAQNIDLFRQKFTRGFKDEIIILVLLFLPVTPISLVSASCGLIKIPPQEFYPLLFVGTLVRATFLGLLGWRVGESYNLLANGLNQIESLLTIISLAIIFSVLFFLYLKRRRILRD